MDASYKIQRGIHVHLIQFFMCPEFWVHITGCLRFLLQFFCYSALPRRRLFRNCIPDRSGYTCLASGKGDLTGKCHDPEKQQKRSPQKAVSSAENRLSGSGNILSLLGKEKAQGTLKYGSALCCMLFSAGGWAGCPTAS